MRTIAGTLLTLALATGCTLDDTQGPTLQGVLGYAAFELECDYPSCEGDQVPIFAIGATFDFSVELSTNFPYHEEGANVLIHRGEQRFIDSAEVQTVMAISKHSDGYLIDYAHVYLFQPSALGLEARDGSALARDDEGRYVIPAGESVTARVVAFHRTNRLEGNLLYAVRSLDSDRLEPDRDSGSLYDLYGRQPGPVTLEVTLGELTEEFEFHVERGPRTNPPAPDEPEPSRTNPAPGTETDAGTDTDAGGDTDTDTDGTTGDGGSGTTGDASTTGGTQ